MIAPYPIFLVLIGSSVMDFIFLIFSGIILLIFLAVVLGILLLIGMAVLKQLQKPKPRCPICLGRVEEHWLFCPLGHFQIQGLLFWLAIGACLCFAHAAYSGPGRGGAIYIRRIADYIL